jgi:hypothetical protein
VVAERSFSTSNTLLLVSCFFDFVERITCLVSLCRLYPTVTVSVT